MVCKKCGCDNPIVKKTCQQCNAILEGETVNNTTGEIGYRNADGSFTAYKDGRIVLKGKIPTLKQQIDRITEEAGGKIQQIVLDHYQQTGVMMSIRLEYVEMTDKLSGGRKTIMPMITLYSTL